MHLTYKERHPIVRELRQKYTKSTKRGKKKILDNLEELGYNRNYASRLMRCRSRHSREDNRGRPRLYGTQEKKLLRKIWIVSDYLCGKRLAPVLEEYIRKAIEFDEIDADESVVQKVCAMSPATIDRLLADDRARMVCKRRSRTKPGTLLREHVPIRTHAQWKNVSVGTVAIDCVGHDGGDASGDFCHTLNMTDVATGWTEMYAVKNKAQVWVFEALEKGLARFPFPVHSIHSDNGSEFINDHLVRYCIKMELMFTRSRAGHKNDNCYVEQKNWSVIRRAVGYARYEGTKHLKTLNTLYDSLRYHVNYFQPSMRLIRKEREGSKVKKWYDTPQTPYQRVTALSEISALVKEELDATYDTLNPIALKRRITRNQRKLLK